MSNSLPDNVFKFSSGTSYPRVIISGGVHGNEPCGVQAVNRLLTEFGNSSLKLLKGELIFVIANLNAIKENVRFIDYNLNRLFQDNSLLENKSCYEVQRAEELKPLYANCDFLLDLHSTSANSKPFLMCEQSELELAQKITDHCIVTGWSAIGESVLSGDTENWARKHGAQAFTLECGQHQDVQAGTVGYQASIAFLTQLGCIAGSAKQTTFNPNVLSIYHCQTKTCSQFAFVKKFCGLDFLPAGTLIGRDSKIEYHCEEDCFIVMPTDPAIVQPGGELYCLARGTSSIKN